MGTAARGIYAKEFVYIVLGEIWAGYFSKYFIKKVDKNKKSDKIATQEYNCHGNDKISHTAARN
jgi:hypothetical protein